MVDSNGVGHEVVAIHKFECGCMTGRQHNVRCDSGLQCFLPPLHAQTPSVPRFESRKAIFAAGGSEVISAFPRKRKELIGHHGADGVQTDIAGAGFTISVPIKSGHWRSAAAFERSAQYIGWHGSIQPCIPARCQSLASFAGWIKTNHHHPMPVVQSTFAPPRWLANGHIQTILPAVWPRRMAVPYVRERLELDDGDFLDLDVLDAGHSRVAVISHGLEGSSGDVYVRSLATVLAGRGWDVVAWNYRGCSGEPNRLPRSYHSGDTDDLARVINHASRGGRRVALVGFSLGGNLSLKWAGERPAYPGVVAAVGISAPVDLASSAAKLDRHPANHVYLRRLIARLEKKIRAKAIRFPAHVRSSDLVGVHGFAELDDRFTAPMHGFRDARDYWTKSSARPFLPAIRVPALLLNALDDPFLAPECFPFPEAASSGSFSLETPSTGGHLGFIECAWARHHWAEWRVAEFLDEV